MDQSATPYLYDRSRITYWLGSETLTRALPLVRHVSGMAWDDNVLSGDVQGSQRLPYEVSVSFRRQGSALWMDGECTCPISYNCKHVGALLLANLDDQAAESGAMRPELANWLEQFRQRQILSAGKTSKIAAGGKVVKPTQALVYVLRISPYDQLCDVLFYKASLDRDGKVKALGEAWSNVEKALIKPPAFIQEEDLGILRMLWLNRSKQAFRGFTLVGANGSAVLAQMLATGRTSIVNTAQQPNVMLQAGPARPASLQWEPGRNDRLSPVLQTAPVSTELIVVEPFWYVDQVTGEAGMIEMAGDAARIADYLSMPPITPAEAALVAAALREIAPDLPRPPVLGTNAMPVVDVAPQPVLYLDTLPFYAHGFRHTEQPLDHATVRFVYGEFSFEVGSTATLVRPPGGELQQVKRRFDAEKARIAELAQLGLEVLHLPDLRGPEPFPATMWGFADAAGWTRFMQQGLPHLRADGWQVEVHEDFHFNVIDIDEIEGQLHEAGNGWFDLQMEITVGDRPVRLESLLPGLFAQDARWLTGGLEQIPDNEPITIRTERGERLRFSADRLKPVVRLLIDLFDGLGDGPLRVSRFDAGRLEALTGTGRWKFHGDDSIRELGQRLKNAAGVTTVPVPEGLNAELRAYQQQGLSWMQFLREQDLAGVLADDMGLGKTMQTLAHILCEKEAGRLDRPALIVVPTSLMFNWSDEAQRFAPGLSVLSLHGSGRKELFDTIDQHDIVLTTYALLWRDHEVLATHSYHLLILDEAQSVKNVRTKAAVAIRDINARHRLCLTGTPLENHLGELWSLFDFLLPGFLGTEKDFGKRWRTPIEKGGDTVRRDLLARRIRPFMLRRRKDEVATELPPKTLITRRVELTGAQRDLYEIVRSAMQEKVRAAIATQGLARSHIVVLDALLKLRQVCCDPRLVRLDQATDVQESAKLELLLTMLPDLIEEGRKVLLFSQFTGMLDLIAQAVEEAGIPYVKLTGETTDRATPVKQFQAGEVPLFLISLKAGGVGLNLTAADTVIHYDPWWNPAAENQATDRAHRLGQDKPVFVYKLIAAGSIEEKIVLMQDKKAALAQGILSEDGAAAVKFSADDVEGLFAPMPTLE